MRIEFPLSKVMRLCALVFALLSILFAAPAQATTTVTGSLTAGQYAYQDITLPSPQSGLRLVLSTTSTSSIFLYTGTNHVAGSMVASSTSKTLHTLLVAPESLSGGAGYHVRIYAAANLSYSFTSDLKYLNNLAWDGGTSLDGSSAVAQPDTAGGDYVFKVTGQSPVHGGWRNVLKVTGGEADLYLQQGSAPISGGSYSSVNVGSDTINLSAGSWLNGQDWYIRVHATPGSTWQLTSGDLYVQDLTWDPGTSAAGSSNLSQPSTAAGDYFFRVTSKASAYGAWRSALKVTGGEADLYMQQNNPALGDTQFKSVQIGSDGLILSSDQFADNQTWYIRVRATAGATWNILSGDIYVHDLGTLSDTGSSTTVQLGPEGTYYFKNSVDANTPAWRLWLNGSSNQIYVSRGKAPVKSVWVEQAEQSETGQALLVPPYLTSALYVVGVKGSPGSSFTLDSRKQPILTPSAVTGYVRGGGAANFDFTLSSQSNSGGFGYLTYRIDVPVQQIAWQVNVTPGSAGQNPELYLRKGDVPNRWMNDALSEAPAGVTDSITQVPPTLTDGAWYVTVYGSGSYTFSLSSGNPVITGATFINTSDPTPVPAGYSYPYMTVPLTNAAPFVSRTGWRYYQVSDINSQLGFLGWQLDLANHVPGSEIALRSNGVPARWSYRTGGSSYSTDVREANHLDLSSTLGFLQHPGHPADIWYVGVYTPNQALGAFQLATRDIPSPLNDFSQSSVSVSDQNPASWRWFKYTVPSDSALKGWDLRLKATAGTPQMVVRRDQLPGDFTTTMNYSVYRWLYDLDTWASGSQWAASPGADWTERSYLTYSPTYTMDKNGYLIMGMGRPLEPGTYYVGVSRASGSDATPMSYTLESRGIGLAGSSYPIKVQDLSYAGGVATGTGLAPREVGWYRVVVPNGADSWSVNLVPSQGEAMLALRQGVLPNVMAGRDVSDSNQYPAGAKRQKSGTEYFYKYASESSNAITAGEYYLAVISEGQNPTNRYTIGTGAVNYTLTSVGAMPVSDKTSTPIAVGSVLAWGGESVPYTAQKVYRFRVPAGLTSVEVRLKNKVGNPLIGIHKDVAGAGKIPYVYSPLGNYGTNEGGASSQWQNVYNSDFTNVVTIASPVAGDYTIVVRAEKLVNGDLTDAAFDLEVKAMTPTLMQLSTTTSLSGSLVDQQVAYYQVEVPARLDGHDLAGWKLKVQTSAGNATLRVAKGEVPGGTTLSLSTASPTSIIAPPYLSPGTWFIEVKGTGITDYVITSDIISADPAKHRRSWTMPDRNNLAASGAPFKYPAGLSAPEIGDSGLDDQGNPIPNLNTGDQGTDLAQNDWHFYRIVVPQNNGGHLKTVLESLSGTPELYLRAGGAPSPYHYASATNPNDYYAGNAYDRSQAVDGTMYGNWVPLDRRIELELAPGDWWIGIKAVRSNIRYRLKVAAGNVRDANGPVDSPDSQLRLFQDLNQNGGSYTGQSLAAGNMRYYRVTIPASSTTQASSTPLDWTVTLQQQVGDVAIFLRDTLPPGLGADGNAARDANAILNMRAHRYFSDWYYDNIERNPDPYPVFDAPGAHTVSLPPVRPGATYYLGVYAKTDATFDLSSAAGADRLKIDGVVPYAGGTLSTTLAAGERKLYRIDVPREALVWRHSAVHNGGIKLYLEQGTVPTGGASPLWSSSGSADSWLNQNLDTYNWQPGYSYYLLVENTTAGALPFTLETGGRSTLSALTVNVAGNCPGSRVTTSPNVLTCTSGSCSADLMPYSGVYLNALPGPGCAVAVTGACTGSGCFLDLASSATFTATFTDIAAPYITGFSLPATSSVATVAVTLGATDNVGVSGYCLSESSSSAGCGWQTAAPSSYTFSGIADNTPTGRYLYAYAKDAAGNISRNDAYVTVTLPTARLTVNVNGTGSGSVNSTPSGIACTGGSCSHDYTIGSAATLLQAASAGSQFAGWSGACTGSGTCSVTLSADKIVTATFNSLPPVRIAGATPVYFATMQAAYDAAKSGDVIELKEGVLPGKLTANRAITVKVKGGFDSGYGTNRGGLTVISPIAIRQGKVLSELVAVR